jgi:sulfoxide reductase heme-binding subunit YedZ
MATVLERPPRIPGSSQVTPARSPRAQIETVALWCFRALMITPFVLMGPELISYLLGQPGAAANIAESTADIFGTSSLLFMVLMLAVTPVYTMTGWAWHLPLRRDYGVAMFASAAVDLVLAALTTGETFSGGVLGRIGGRTFLVAGTLAVFLLLPLAVTSTRRAHLWLGSYWKRLHRLTYVIWAIVLLHLLLLFGIGGIFVQAVTVSVPLVLLRLPPLRRWWSAARRKHRHRILRGVLAVALVATFAAGLRPIISELAFKGQAAFIQQPID